MKAQRSLRTALGVLACVWPAVLYRPTLDNPFVFDDRTTVLLNPRLIDPWHLRAVVLDFPARFAVNLSYVVDRALWGFSSFGFHVTNFVLHIIVVGLVYGWCTRALTDGVKPGSDPSPAPAPEWPAFFAAATFGLHPLMGSTALYVSARSELLCAAAFLLALMFRRRAILAPGTGPAALAIGFGAVAASASPAGAALPVVMLAYDRWVLRAKGWERRRWRMYLPVFAVAAVTGAWRLRAALSVDHVPSRSFLDNLLTESIVIWRYVRLLVFPAGQAVVHDVRWIASPVDPLGLLALAGIALAVAGAVSLRRKAPAAAVGAIWFLAALAPTSSLIPLRDPMAEPRLYVAAAGLIFAVFSALAPLLAERRVARLAATAALVILASAASTRSRVWTNPLVLWTEAVQRAPGAWQAHAELANALEEIGACDRAEQEYSAAVRLNPTLPVRPPEAWRPSCSQGRVRR